MWLGQLKINSFNDFQIDMTITIYYFNFPTNKQLTKIDSRGLAAAQ